ncbi:MAG: hypothetical protein GPJ00_01045 [Microcystis aeruginosa W13-18]|nr:hypothetical protein [Microcystis aeruginosa W13-18]NCR34949.1 hypothetical protein [Microcystis aeruginosa S11-05]NCR48428.1 hypothetical protein [Microcystis aeruginosa S11-01]
MAGQDWRKNKKGFMVNPEGKTARQVRAEKRQAAKASGGGGGEDVDTSRYLENNTNKNISTEDKTTRFDIDMVSSRKKASDFEVESDAQKIAKTGGVLTNIPLVAMTKGKKIEVVASDRDFFAAKRAQEIDPNREMMRGMFLKASQIKGALAQKRLFKDHEGDLAVVSGKFSRVDTPDISSSQKPPSKKVLEQQIQAILDTGDAGNVVPVVIKRIGKKSLVNQKYEVVSGHDSYHAMRELSRRNPDFEMTNTFILD